MTTINDCLVQVKSRLQSIADFKTTTEIVYSPEELIRVLKGFNHPGVGIAYEGMRGLPESGGTSRGMGVVAAFGLYMVVDSIPLSSVVNVKNPAIDLLSKMRGTLFDTRGPGGHFWQFMSETYSDSYPGKAMWIQRWTTRLMLPS